MTSMHEPLNTTKPGQPEYVGPDAGWALFVHHDRLLEWCYSFRERIDFIKREKQASEVPIRLACLTYVPEERVPAYIHQARTAYDQAWTAYDQACTAHHQARTAQDQAWTAYDQAWTAYAQALDGIRRELAPDAPWNGARLLFEVNA